MAVGGRDRTAGGWRADRRAWVAAPALAVVVAACSDDPMVVTPVIDTPADDMDATAAPLDEITLTVAHAKSDRDLVSQTFSRGESIEVPGVPFGDDLVFHMSGFVGASNVAYGRTCAVAVAAGTKVPTPHLFFSRSVKFASLGIAPQPRTGGLGIPYLGAALLVGGSSGPDPVVQVERFDPMTGQLSVVGPVAARSGVVQALLGTLPPRVVVIGGIYNAGGATFLEVLDDRGIERLDNFTEMARVDLTATSLTDGRIMAIGGNPPGQPPTGEIDEIALNDGTIEVRKVGVALAYPRSGHTATRLGDDVGAPVLIAGGVDASGAPVARAELFKPLSEELAPPTFVAMMLVPRRGHAATLMPDGSVLFIGGVDAKGLPVQKLERFSVDTGFVDAGELPVNAGVIDFSATTLPDGRILLVGGRQMPDATPTNNAYIARLNPLDGSVDVVATDHLAIARAGHQAQVLCDGTVLITGGTAATFPAERYNPPPAGRR